VTTIDRDTVQFGSARYFHASVIGTARKSSIAAEGGFIVRVDHKLTPFLELEATGTVEIIRYAKPQGLHLNRRRVYLCAGRLRKRASDSQLLAATIG